MLLCSTRCFWLCVEHIHADAACWIFGLRCTRPVDLRIGATGLALLAKETLGRDPMKGVAVAFRAKRMDRVKIVIWDGSGLIMYWKRLENDDFRSPSIVDGVMRMNGAQLSAMLAGMDWTRMHASHIPRTYGSVVPRKSLMPISYSWLWKTSMRSLQRLTRRRIAPALTAREESGQAESQSWQDSGAFAAHRRNPDAARNVLSVLQRLALEVGSDESQRFGLLFHLVQVTSLQSSSVS